MRRTKIVCTLGPASEDIEILRSMIRAGMEVARLNFSHGSHKEHLRRIKAVREAAKLEDRLVPMMLDMKGPEIRIGELKNEPLQLKEGNNIVLTSKIIQGTEEAVSITYDKLPEDIKRGDVILLDDGIISLKVEDVSGSEIRCIVVEGGGLKSHKGVNVPGVEVRLPPVTEKDYEDIMFGIEKGIDFIAISFVKKAEDILEVRKILEDKNNEKIKVIAKIENQAGVNNIDDILQVVDGVMVARGDLGVEIPPEEVPLIQKKLIKKCNSAGKPVITATHMLDSMERNPRPTRAESSDVANAIFDGSDAVMLSGETAIGKYPVETIKTMAKLATITEEALEYEKIGAGNQEISHQSITDAISYATYTIAANLNASAILTPTASGSTARMISKYRPKGPIIAVSANEDTLNYLCLVWGVFPIKVPWLENTDEVFDAGIAAALDKRFIEHGDLVVVTAGIPIGVPGTTNLLKVHVVGEILGKGTALGKQIVKGCAKVAATHEEACENIEEGDILVTAETDKNYIPALKKAAAVVTEKGGLSSHAVISALNFKIPAIIGAEGVCKNIKNGEMITIDGLRGIIYRGAAKVTS